MSASDRLYLINEIFYSLQGEGVHTGVPAVFVRFSGCNLKCSFCDTDHLGGSAMTAQEIIDEVNKHEAPTVILTGGEPSLQIDEDLVNALHTAGKRIHIETNGTRPLPAGIDWITLSPKAVKPVLTSADEIKVIYTGSLPQDHPGYDAIADPEQVIEGLTAKHYLLQPCSCDNVEATVDYIKAHPKWRLSLQTHKLISIP